MTLLARLVRRDCGAGSGASLLSAAAMDFKILLQTILAVFR